MRGKAWNLFLNYNSFRITPAYAGKSGLRSKIERNDGDHPRLCGEKCRRIPCTIKHIRITPAYAGKRNWSGIPP